MPASGQAAVGGRACTAHSPDTDLPPPHLGCFPALPSPLCRSKTALLYAAYAFVIAAAVAVGLAVALNCPSVASSSLFVLLVMLVLAWSAVWASTAGLKVGSDG